MAAPKEIFYPIETAEKMIADLESCTLPRDEWDHGTHLVTGFYCCAVFGNAAYLEMKKRILQYNKCCENQGYHETMTRFWIWAIDHYRRKEIGRVAWQQTDLDELIFDDNLTHRNLWNEYYSRALMMSDKARNSFVPPDLQPFPFS